MSRVAIYSRVSSRCQAEKGLSLEAQEKAGIEICKKRGFEFKVYTEAGRSAENETLDNRPVINQILDEIDEGKYQYIFVTELDRLSRHPASMAVIKKICAKYNVKIITTHQDFDFEQDEDDFLSDLYSILAKRENRLRVKRISRAKIEAIKKGRWKGGILNYGFITDKDKNIIWDKDEIKVYHQMKNWAFEGLGTNTIALKLNQLGIPTKGRKIYRKNLKRSAKEQGFGLGEFKDRDNLKWQGGTVYGILTNGIYKGEMCYKELKIKIPELIPESEWNSLQMVLKSHYNNSNRNKKHFYLLRGLLYCAKCGRKLFGLIKEKEGMRLYACLSTRPNPEPRFCGLKRINIDKLNNLVWAKTKELVSDSEKIKEALKQAKDENIVDKLIQETTVESVDKRIKEIEQQIDRHLELYSRGILSVADLDRKACEYKGIKDNLLQERQQIIEKNEQVRKANENVKNIEAYLNSISKNMDKFTDQEKSEFLHLIIKKVMIDYNLERKEHSANIIYAIPLENKAIKEKESLPPMLIARPRPD